MYTMKATNHRRKARTENYDAAFGSIFRISKFKIKQKLYFIFIPPTRQPKFLKTYAHVLYRKY